MKAAELVLSEEAKQDLRALLNEEGTKPIGVEAMRRLRGLEEEPYQGEKLRYKSNRKPLAQADCRKLNFDDPYLPGDEPARYRIVYRLEPFEGAADRVYVLIVAFKRQPTAKAPRVPPHVCDS